MSREEQIMSKDKYPSIFLRHKEAIVLIILQMFRNKCGFENWEYPLIISPGWGNIRSFDMFRPIKLFHKTVVVA